MIWASIALIGLGIALVGLGYAIRKESRIQSTMTILPGIFFVVLGIHFTTVFNNATVSVVKPVEVTVNDKLMVDTLVANGWQCTANIRPVVNNAGSNAGWTCKKGMEQ